MSKRSETLTPARIRIVHLVQEGCETAQQVRAALKRQMPPTGDIAWLVKQGYLEVAGQTASVHRMAYGWNKVKQNIYRYTGKPLESEDKC